MTRELVVHHDRTALVGETVERLTRVASEVIAERGALHLAISGGSVNIELLGALRDAPIDWSRVHVWWADERFVARDSDERNALAARQALLDHVPVPETQIHELPAAGDDLGLDDAAAVATAELGTTALDVVLLGMGPDAHVASLFPGNAGVEVVGVGVVAVRDSPKPPPQRLSLTFDAIARASRVWVVVAGDDKASALALALTAADRVEVPATGVSGTLETRYLVDRDATALLPDGMVD